MAESEELETLVYCLGPVGGQENPVVTKAPEYTSKLDYTTKGYARYVEEANNVIKFQYLVVNYFLESVKSEFEEDPLAFIDAESKEELMASILKMKKQWKGMLKEHQKHLKECLRNQQQAMVQTEEESSSSSAKAPRLDPAATPEAGSKDPELASRSGSVGIPAERIEFPDFILLRKAKAITRVLKTEYLEFRARMGKALDRISIHGTSAHDLRGFTLQNMEKFAKWKYDLKTLSHLVPELESKLGELDLDLNEVKENETRITEWMYFDDGKKDRKYHHRLLLTLDLTGPVAQISTLTWKQIRRWKKLSKSLASKLPTESEAFEEKVEQWRREVVRHSPKKKPFEVQKSTDSEDTLYGRDDMPEET